MKASILVITAFSLVLVPAFSQTGASTAQVPLSANSPGNVVYDAMPPGQANAVSPPSQGVHYLASIIPTPSLQSTTGGTAGVRNASDSSLSATRGSGEGLRQARPAATATSSKFYLQDDFPNLLPLPFSPLYSVQALANFNPSCTPNSFYYQVEHYNNSVSKIGTCPLMEIKEIPVCSNPLSIAVTPDGSTAVVTCYDGVIDFIDTATDNVTTLPAFAYNPGGVDITPDGSTAWVTSYIDNPSVIFTVNLQTRQINPQTIQVTSYPKNIFLTPDGAMAWVNFYQSSQIYIIDTASMTIVKAISAGGNAEDGIAFTPDGTRAYIAVTGGSISVFDTATLTMLKSIPVADQPSGVLVSKEGSRVYVASSASNNPVLSVIDVASNTVVAKYPQAGPTLGLTIYH